MLLLEVLLWEGLLWPSNKGSGMQAQVLQGGCPPLFLPVYTPLQQGGHFNLDHIMVILVKTVQIIRERRTVLFPHRQVGVPLGQVNRIENSCPAFMSTFH